MAAVFDYLLSCLWCLGLLFQGAFFDCWYISGKSTEHAWSISAICSFIFYQYPSCDLRHFSNHANNLKNCTQLSPQQMSIRTLREVENFLTPKFEYRKRTLYPNSTFRTRLLLAQRRSHPSLRPITSQRKSDFLAPNKTKST